MELGAEAVVTERPVEGARCMIVDSTARALLDIAGYYRSKFDVKVVGVTGSVGKTTTKDMMDGYELTRQLRKADFNLLLQA